MARAAIQNLMESRLVDAGFAELPLFQSRQGALKPRQARNLIRKCFISAGLPPEKTWSGHSLRRRFVQRLYSQTRDLDLVRTAVGHRWAATTQLYLGLNQDEADGAILRMGSLSELPTAARNLELAAV